MPPVLVLFVVDPLVLPPVVASVELAPVSLSLPPLSSPLDPPLADSLTLAVDVSSVSASVSVSPEPNVQPPAPNPATMQERTRDTTPRDPATIHRA